MIGDCDLELFHMKQEPPGRKMKADGVWRLGIFITPNRNTCSDNNNKVKYWDLIYLKSLLAVKKNSSWVIQSANLHLKQKQNQKKNHRKFGASGKFRCWLLRGLDAPHLHKGGVDFTWLLWSPDRARLPGALPCCQRQHSP